MALGVLHIYGEICWLFSRVIFTVIGICVTPYTRYLLRNGKVDKEITGARVGKASKDSKRIDLQREKEAL